MDQQDQNGTSNFAEKSNDRLVQERLLLGLERSLPSLDRLLSEYHEAVEEKNRFEFELKHETQIANDLQSELDYLQKAMERNAKHEAIQKRVDKLANIEAIHRELKQSIQATEDKIALQDEETKAAIESAKMSARQLALMDEQEFQTKFKELENKFNMEINKVRESLKMKANQLKAAKQKAEFEHSQRKEELRKVVANRMKSTSHHIECRSVELDLKKQIALLEKDVKQLEQQRSRRKLPLPFASESPVERTSVSLQRPNQPMNKRKATPAKQSPVPTNDKQSASSTSRSSARKRKLFSVNSDFLDF